MDSCDVNPGLPTSHGPSHVCSLIARDQHQVAKTKSLLLLLNNVKSCHQLYGREGESRVADRGREKLGSEFDPQEKRKKKTCSGSDPQETKPCFGSHERNMCHVRF